MARCPDAADCRPGHSCWAGTKQMLLVEPSIQSVPQGRLISFARYQISHIRASVFPVLSVRSSSAHHPTGSEVRFLYPVCVIRDCTTPGNTACCQYVSFI